MEFISTLLLIFSFSVQPCQPAEDKPYGSMKNCRVIGNNACCDWHYVEDRFCIQDDECCTKLEAANDSMDALRTQHTWCYEPKCGWLLKKEGYYNNWESNDHWSKANRKARKLVMKGKYKQAKRFARRALKKLVRLGLCKKNEPCDDNLEFIAYASKKELQEATKQWAEDQLGC